MSKLFHNFNQDGWSHLREWLEQMPLERLAALVAAGQPKLRNHRIQKLSRKRLIQNVAEWPGGRSLQAFEAVWRAEGKWPDVQTRDVSYYDQLIEG
jgi:hypothetical protein